MKTQFIQSAAKPWPVRTGPRQRGFTLIELIMVMVMLGVLAVFAAPRIFNSDDFYARGFHDETLALLRYAQKAAIAQRRTVCVTFTSNNMASLIMAKDAATTDCSSPTTTALVGPNGSPTIKAKSIVIYNPTPTPFNFDGLGQPMSTAGVLLSTRTDIQINNANKVFVEAVTGYVHD